MLDEGKVDARCVVGIIGGRRRRIKISPSILTTAEANLPYYLSPFSANNRSAKLISYISYNEKQTRLDSLFRDGTLIAFFEKSKPPSPFFLFSFSFLLSFFSPRFHFIRLVKIDTRGEWGINRDGRGERGEFSFFLSLPEEFEIRNTRRDFVETLN